MDHDRAYPQFTCCVCDRDGTELCCTLCDPGGLPYHEACWEGVPLHKPNRAQLHRRMPIEHISRILYLIEPNKQVLIGNKTFEADFANCFIELDMKLQRLKFGPRASPLLRHVHNQSQPQYPSFVSFIGPSMSGKSFLLRALQQGGAADKFPTPIPAPGAKVHNSSSTSSDIHLYADWKTADDESPILFLDCEGFSGSDLPSSLSFKAMRDAVSFTTTGRRILVEDAYPRLLYAFSTCVVFVTSGTLAQSSDIASKLLSHASQGAGRSRNQGFKPSLFIVFNRFRDGGGPDFDWSTDSSTEAFLSKEESRLLKLLYDTIHVIYIPSVWNDDADIAVSQIDAFQTLLRQEHIIAFDRRRSFRLNFTPDQLTPFLQIALKSFSRSHESVFNWASETEGFSPSEATAIFQDLWARTDRYYATQAVSPQEQYRLTRRTFEDHVEFCLLLSLARKSPRRVHFGIRPKSLDYRIDQIDQLLLQHAPCAATFGGNTCAETRDRHADYHQGSTGVSRWRGTYEAYKDVQELKFQQIFEKSLKRTSECKFSLRDPAAITLPPEIRSVTSCFGCLQDPTNTILACGHAFCLDCVRDLTADDPLGPLPHRLQEIYCPFHRSSQRLSPRLLPIQSGYRILSLDSGGVKGLAQLILLRHIEQGCFGIPTTQLFDFIVGTNIGGQIALALAAPTESLPLTVAAAAEKFKELMRTGFVRNGLRFGPKWLSFHLNASTYKASAVETQLQDLFGKETGLYRAAAFSAPHIAVTTVSQESSKTYLVTNYNRKSNGEAYPLLLKPDQDACMPIWAAARCTTAVLPYFKPFSWQGQMLLGFQLNCPAKTALSEAQHIWPKKRCDILVSLETGKGTDLEKGAPFSLLRAFSHMFATPNMKSNGIFRLNPVFLETRFALDDYKKLEEVEVETDAWLKRTEVQAQIIDICDRLIAALFFFKAESPANSGKLMGEILCRLPVGLEARQDLIDDMRAQSDRLFMVKFGGKWDYIDVKKSIYSEIELCIPVELTIPRQLSDHSGATELEFAIEMRNLKTHADPSRLNDRWTPISGSPYTVAL